MRVIVQIRRTVHLLIHVVIVVDTVSFWQYICTVMCLLELHNCLNCCHRTQNTHTHDCWHTQRRAGNMSNRHTYMCYCETRQTYMLTRVTLIDSWLVSMIPVIEGIKRHQD